MRLTPEVTLQTTDAMNLTKMLTVSLTAAAMTVAGKALPPGSYGSTESLAAIKDDKHFAGPGMVEVGSGKH